MLYSWNKHWKIIIKLRDNINSDYEKTKENPLAALLNQEKGFSNEAKSKIALEHDKKNTITLEQIKKKEENTK